MGRQWSVLSSMSTSEGVYFFFCREESVWKGSMASERLGLLLWGGPEENTNLWPSFLLRGGRGMGNCLSCSKIRHRRYQSPQDFHQIIDEVLTLIFCSCGLSCPSCLGRQMKQLEVTEDELTDLRAGTKDRLAGIGQGLPGNSSGLFEAGAPEEGLRQQGSSWSPLRWGGHHTLHCQQITTLRWSREAEVRLRAGGEEVGGGEPENLTSSVVRLEVRTIQYFLKV